MSVKFVRFVAALAILLTIAGHTGIVRAAGTARQRAASQHSASQAAPQPRDIPDLTASPASSLGVQFVHVATAANITSNWTTIDHPLTNGNPNALLLVTPNWNPGGLGGTYNNHPIGVWYTGSQWAIFNQDRASVPPGAAFNVLVLSAGPGVFVHKATAGNSTGDYTIMDNALANGNPNAIVFFTPNWNPGGTGSTYNNRATGAWYDGSRWAIFNQDFAPVPANAAFNVYVFGNYHVYQPLVIH